jgi:hypothetical protein
MPARLFRQAAFSLDTILGPDAADVAERLSRQTEQVVG